MDLLALDTAYSLLTIHFRVRLSSLCTHNLGSAATVAMAARLDIASAAANSAQKISTTKVQIVGSTTGSTSAKEQPCTKNRKSKNPGTASVVSDLAARWLLIILLFLVENPRRTLHR